MGDFQEEMEAYVDENGTSLVQPNTSLPSKYKLGMQLSNVRSDGRLWKGTLTRRRGRRGLKTERVDVESSRFRMGDVSKGDGGVRG